MANNILNEILDNQNEHIHAMETLMQHLMGINNSVLENLDNDDESLTDIKNDLTETLSNFNRVLRRQYDYTQQEIVTYSLEEDYKLIINNRPSLSDVSAVGMLAILRPGVYKEVLVQPDDWTTNYDKYFYLVNDEYLSNTDPIWDQNKNYYSFSGDVVRTYGNQLFIDGKESEDYVFRGVNDQEGIEIVKIWWFEKNNTLTISIDNIFSLVDLHVIKKSAEPNITNLTSLEVFNATFDGMHLASNHSLPYSTNLSYNRIGLSDSLILSSSHFIPSFVRTFKSNYREITTGAQSGSLSPFYISGAIRKSLNKVSMPELTAITASATNGRSGFNGCINLNIKKEDIPNLKSIADMGARYGAFGGVKSVELPESVEYVGNNAFGQSANSDAGAYINNKKIKLFSRKAETIYMSNWCSLTPDESFEMTTHWEANIDISKAAANWGDNGRFDVPEIRDQNDTFYLYNMLEEYVYEPTAHHITIPSSFVTDELIDAYMDIGWDLLGA